MPKEPILFKINGKSNTGELSFREQDGFIPPNKFALDPRVYHRAHFTPERYNRIFKPNLFLNKCVLCFERSAGTNLLYTDVETGVALMEKLINEGWKPNFICAGRSFRFCNKDAEPGTPVEIKFYFFEEYKPTEEDGNKEKQEKKKKAKTIDQIIEALKHFYMFEEVEVDSQIVYKALNKEPSFIRIELEDLKTKIVGRFFAIGAPEEKPVET